MGTPGADDQMILDWTLGALDGTITKVESLNSGEVYLQNIVEQTPGASLVNNDSVLYYGFTETFEGRLLNGKWVVNLQDFLDFKEDSYCSYLAAMDCGTQIGEIDANYHCTEIHHMEDLVWACQTIVNGQSLDDARLMLINLSISTIATSGSVVVEMLKSLACNMLELVGEGQAAAVLGLPTSGLDGAKWTVSSILDFANDYFDTAELKQLACALVKSQIAGSFANGVLATESHLILYLERLNINKGVVESLTQYGNLSESEFQHYKSYLLNYYNLIIDMNQNNWQVLHDDLYCAYDIIDGMFA